MEIAVFGWKFESKLLDCVTQQETHVNNAWLNFKLPGMCWVEPILKFWISLRIYESWFSYDTVWNGNFFFVHLKILKKFFLIC